MADFLIPEQIPNGRQVMGWDGVDFRVLDIDVNARLVPPSIPLYFNYKDAYHQIGSDLNAAVGWDDLTLAGPGANEILVIKTLYAYDATSNITQIFVGMIAGATTYNVHTRFPTAANIPAVWSGTMICEAGFAPWAGFAGTVAGDDIWFTATGYIMRTDW